MRLLRTTKTTTPSAGAKMSFLEHLDELRKRIVRSCLAVAFGVVATFYWIQPIFNFILAPTRRALPPGVKLIYTQPGEAFSLYITVALDRGRRRRRAVHHVSGLDVHRARPVLEREADGVSVRVLHDGRIRGRRRVQPLRRRSRS